MYLGKTCIWVGVNAEREPDRNSSIGLAKENGGFNFIWRKKVIQNKVLKIHPGEISFMKCEYELQDQLAVLCLAQLNTEERTLREEGNKYLTCLQAGGISQ